MSTPSLLAAVDLTKRFGGLVAVNAVSFELGEAEILGLIGPNGAGKSTLLALLAGSLKPTSGQVRLKGENISGRTAHRVCQRGVSRTHQIPRPFSELTVEDNVRCAFAYARRRWASSPQEILDFCQLSGKSAAFPSELTHADLRRLEFARGLATGPLVLLLDELGAGLTEAEIRQFDLLIREVRDRGVAIIIVEHVMSLVMQVSDRIVVVDRGRKIAEGRPDEVAADPVVVTAYLGEQ